MYDQSWKTPSIGGIMEMIERAIGQVDWKEKEILVGCSGGVDSIVLVHALVKSGFKPTILHVNYQLRGSDSDEDERLVKNLADQLHLAIIIEKCPKELTKGKGINLQNAARNFRHNLFQKWIKQSDQHVVALAHHLDDQVETFFLQLFRGSGLYGLGGMEVERNGIIRPFLAMRKSELYTCAVENQLKWREDRSNQEAIYLRNLFRLKLLPQLEINQPDLFQNVAYFMTCLRNEQQLLEKGVLSCKKVWDETGELAIDTWKNWTEDQRFAFLKLNGFPAWTFNRFNDLSDTETGKRVEINEWTVYKTKSGKFKKANKESDLPWEYKIEIINCLPNLWDKQSIYLDPEKLKGELKVRKVRPEDRIDSLGMNGTQLVTKVLKDAGVPSAERLNQWVLVDDESVIWIPELKISRRVAAGQNARLIWQIKKVNC